MNTTQLIALVIATGLLAWSLSRYAAPALPTAGVAAQGVLGVYTGLMLQSVSFDALGSDWPIVIAVAVGTLVISIVGGALLGMHRGVSPLTGALALVAGGASGVVAIARDLGGDDRVVAAIQYLRVGLITASMPVVVSVFFQQSATGHVAEIGRTGSLPLYYSLPLIALIVVAGAKIARAVRIPAAGLLGPLAITIALQLTGLTAGLAVPMVLVQAAILLIAWQSAMGCTRESLRAIRRILPSALALILVLNVAAAAMGAVLAQVAGLSMLDGYLATSPGGIYAVLATAAGTGSDVPFVMAVQVIRIVLMLVAAPFIAKAFVAIASRKRVTVDAETIAEIDAIEVEALAANR